MIDNVPVRRWADSERYRDRLPQVLGGGWRDWRAYALGPRELLDRLASEYERRRERVTGITIPVTVDSQLRVHNLLKAEFPCAVCDEFDAVWREVVLRTGASHHHDAGRGAAAAAWTIARHLGPRRTVETGVARGIITATVLAAIERNGSGHLYSIDLPEVGLIRRGELAAAVDVERAEAWTYVRAASRRALPAAFEEMGGVDFFIHDSLHTYANMAFELELAWSALAPTGAILVDDAAWNSAFVDLAATTGAEHVLLLEDEKKAGSYGILRKRLESERRGPDEVMSLNDTVS